MNKDGSLRSCFDKDERSAWPSHADEMADDMGFLLPLPADRT